MAEDLWREKYREWMEQESLIKAEIKGFETRELATYDIFKNCIEQAKTLYSKWFGASKRQKRKMVEILASNLILSHGSVEYHWRKP